MRSVLWLLVLMGVQSSEVQMLGHDHNLGQMQRRALTAANDLNLPADLHAEISRALSFSHRPLQTASLIELDEGTKDQQKLQQLLGAASGNQGSMDMSKVMAKIQILENKLWSEETKAKSIVDKEVERAELEVQDLNNQIATGEELRKSLALSEQTELRARQTAMEERKKSRLLEMEMEKVLQDIRREKQQGWDAYVQRRDQRRKDVMVLHTAVGLVCTFDTFKDDERCKLNTFTAAVPLPPSTPIHADMSLKALAEEANAAQGDSSKWNERLEKDLADIEAGKVPRDYVFDQDSTLRTQSLFSMIQTGASTQEDIARELLATDTSARATGPLQTLLVAIKTGDSEKSSKLLDLVISLLDETEMEQKGDSAETKIAQAALEKRLVQQDASQRAEESRQEGLMIQMQQHAREADRLKQRSYDQLQQIHRTVAKVAHVTTMKKNTRRLYKSQKQIRDEEFKNIERLRSLLLVLSGQSDPPSCDSSDMNKCTAAEQGMCVFASGPVQREPKSEEYCACEWGFYGTACQHKMCPGKLPGRNEYGHFEKGTEGACGSVEKGTCDPATGKCTCEKFTTGTACERFTTCPGGTNCNGHGQCDLKSGKCLCDTEHYGDSCERRKCPGTEIGALQSLFDADSPASCTGHGICGDDGKCQCVRGFSGPNCARIQCLDDCSGKGECNSQTSKCNCDPGYTGDTCRYKKCPGDCSGVGGVCDRDSGICRCHKGFSGMSCQASHSCHVQETSYRDWAMFKPGWSKCPHGSIIIALRTGSCSSIDCIDKARCAKPCIGSTPVEISHCYQANWWDSLNAKGWSRCREPYFLSGLYRNKCNSLYCIEMGLCCSVKGASYGSCGVASTWGRLLGIKQSWAAVPRHHFLTGVYRHGATTEIRDLKKAAHCTFWMDQQEMLGPES